MGSWEQAALLGPALLVQLCDLAHTNSSLSRHRLEEGQATSWSRRLKVFLCCTRTKDSQSVSAGRLRCVPRAHVPLSATRDPSLLGRAGWAGLPGGSWVLSRSQVTADS